MIKSYMKDGKKLYEVYVAERDINKKIIARRKRGITSERAAKEVEFEFKMELKKIADQTPQWTWSAWHEEFLRRIRLNFKNSTVVNYDGCLKRWIPEDWGNKGLEQISSEDIYEVLRKVGAELSAISQKNNLKMIKRILQVAVDEGILSRNPAKGIAIKVPQVNQKVLTAKEAEILLTVAKSTNHRFYPVWAFALKTGMRSGEMYALKWSDIDFEAGIISVNKQWTSKDGITAPKNRENRVVPISKDLYDFLLELRRGELIEGDHILPRLPEWTNGEQAKVLRDFCVTLKITPIKFHDLRATFITNMLAQGVPLVKVMAIVGHRKMETTDIYLRLAGIDLKGATDALGYSVPNVSSHGNVVAMNFEGSRR